MWKNIPIGQLWRYQSKRVWTATTPENDRVLAYDLEDPAGSASPHEASAPYARPENKILGSFGTERVGAASPLDFLPDTDHSSMSPGAGQDRVV